MGTGNRGTERKKTPKLMDMDNTVVIAWGWESGERWGRM